MALSDELISQFVKNTKDEQETKSESIVYGTTVEHEGATYVRIDGSELLTPIATTTNVTANERVTVMIKNHTATVTGNISSPAARMGDIEDQADAITAMEIAIAKKVDTETLNAETARIDTLVSENVTIKEHLTAAEGDIDILQTNILTVNEKLTARDADIENLKTTKLDASVAEITYATIASLEATDADIYNLNATYADFVETTTEKLNAAEADIQSLNVDKLSANAADLKYATIEQLKATNADVDNLEADVADIDTLIFGSATGTSIHTSFANAVIAQLGDAQIKSAMIENVSASKITSGDIITNNVRVLSEDGKLIISDETIQISDGNRIRVQIGKDASNDYSINIWDADGNLMFSEGGITDDAIKEAIIRNDMVSDTANIAAHKLDIDSLFEEINDSEKTIKSTRIYLDDQAQTLDVAFETVTTDIEEIQNGMSSQGTQITAIQGQIASKIWQQDINTAVSEVNETTDNLSTQYEELVQEVDGLSATAASHTSILATKADSSTVTEVSNRVTSIEASLDGFESTVSNTYVTKTEFKNLEVGGRNLVAGTDETREYVGNASGATNGYKDVWTGKTIGIADGTEYIVSFDAKADVAQTIRCHFYSPNTTTSSLSSTGQSTESGDGVCDVTITTEWARYWVKWTQTPAETAKNIIVGRNLTENDIYIRAVKFEAGNTPTDWTPAPEDMATSDELDTLQSSAEMVEIRVSTTESLIQQLSDSIATLITDANGESLMTQTSGGWTFSTGQIQSIVDTTSENLDALTNEVGSISSTVGILQQAVDDLGVLTDYVKITTYENEPCIELGETDSDFKLLITNTRIMFKEGTGVPAYLNNQSLFVKKAVIEEELEQGQFVWKARSNGNLGLMWKGVTS